MHRPSFNNSHIVNSSRRGATLNSSNAAQNSAASTNFGVASSLNKSGGGHLSGSPSVASSASSSSSLSAAAAAAAAAYVTTSLPSGWRREEMTREAGLCDAANPSASICYLTNNNSSNNNIINSQQQQQQSQRPIRSLVQLQRALGDKYNVANFDWRAGKFLGVVATNNAAATAGMTSSKRQHTSVAAGELDVESTASKLIKCHADHPNKMARDFVFFPGIPCLGSSSVNHRSDSPNNNNTYSVTKSKRFSSTSANSAAAMTSSTTAVASSGTPATHAIELQSGWTGSSWGGRIGIRRVRSHNSSQIKTNPPPNSAASSSTDNANKDDVIILASSGDSAGKAGEPAGGGSLQQMFWYKAVSSFDSSPSKHSDEDNDDEDEKTRRKLPEPIRIAASANAPISVDLSRSNHEVIHCLLDMMAANQNQQHERGEQVAALPITGQQSGGAAASSLAGSPGSSSSSCASDKNPCLAFNPAQPPIKSLEISDQSLLEQTRKIQILRKKMQLIQTTIRKQQSSETKVKEIELRV